MIENILDLFSTLNPAWIYFALFLFAFIENVFPPSPSDLVVLIGGSLIATHSLHFIPTLFFTTAGSVLGFMTLFFIGSQLDKKIVRAGKIKFISVEGMDKAEKWFLKYGYIIILANRFLPGTRSIISFFAGLSELDIKRTSVYATISALVWNTVIIYFGIIFGKKIHIVDKYISTYSNIVVATTIIIAVIFIARYFYQKRKKRKIEP
ncbi:MAG: DedA family protein [Ignavibacteriaceae bacterium]